MATPSSHQNLSVAYSPNQMDERSETGTSETKNSPPFACPICKAKSHVWIYDMDCGNKRSTNLKDLLRHHVMTTHRKLSDKITDPKDPRFIAKEVFEELGAWFNNKNVRKTWKEQGAIKMWNHVYDTVARFLYRDSYDTAGRPDPYWTIEWFDGVKATNHPDSAHLNLMYDQEFDFNPSKMEDVIHAVRYFAHTSTKKVRDTAGKVREARLRLESVAKEIEADANNLIRRLTSRWSPRHRRTEVTELNQTPMQQHSHDLRDIGQSFSSEMNCEPKPDIDHDDSAMDCDLPQLYLKPPTEQADEFNLAFYELDQHAPAINSMHDTHSFHGQDHTPSPASVSHQQPSPQLSPYQYPQSQSSPLEQPLETTLQFHQQTLYPSPYQQSLQQQQQFLIQQMTCLAPDYQQPVPPGVQRGYPDPNLYRARSTGNLHVHQQAHQALRPRSIHEQLSFQQHQLYQQYQQQQQLPPYSPTYHSITTNGPAGPEQLQRFKAQWQAQGQSPSQPWPSTE